MAELTGLRREYVHVAVAVADSAHAQDNDNDNEASGNVGLRALRAPPREPARRGGPRALRARGGEGGNRPEREKQM